MTPKEKAKELVTQFEILAHPIIDMDLQISKECALVTIEQIRNFHKSLFYVNGGSIFADYLNETIKEINNL